jgi:hypothetical protein
MILMRFFCILQVGRIVGQVIVDIMVGDGGSRTHEDRDVDGVVLGALDDFLKLARTAAGGISGDVEIGVVVSLIIHGIKPRARPEQRGWRTQESHTRVEKTRLVTRRKT